MTNDNFKLLRRSGEWSFTFVGENGGLIQGNIPFEDNFGVGEDGSVQRRAAVRAKIRNLVAELNFVLNQEENAHRE